MMNCSICPSYSTCHELCDRAEHHANQDYVPRHEDPSHVRLFEYSTRDYKEELNERREHQQMVTLEAVEKIKEMQNTAKKATIALKFFGFSYREIAKLIPQSYVTVFRWYSKSS